MLRIATRTHTENMTKKDQVERKVRTSPIRVAVETDDFDSGAELRIISGDVKFSSTKEAVDWAKTQQVVPPAEEGTDFYIIRAVKKVTIKPRVAFDVDEGSF